MNDLICLNPAYSTTRCLMKGVPPINGTLDAKLKSVFFLDPCDSRKGEGGLRKQRYFKSDIVHSPSESDVSPLITIITAVFNGDKTLEKAIQSVISQSYDNIEFIIIDGGSTDATVDILKKYEHAIDYWVSEKDRGIYDAWNKGVMLARGQWIAFLGADDLYLDDAIKSYVACIKNDHAVMVDYISSKINLTNGSYTLRVVGKPWSWKIFRKYMGVAHVGSLHNRRLFERYGLFDDAYKISGDYEFLLRPGAALRAHFLNVITVDMLVGGASDVNSLVFQETTRAKISTGRRNFFCAYVEKYTAIMKWKVRGYFRGWV